MTRPLPQLRALRAAHPRAFLAGSLAALLLALALALRGGPAPENFLPGSALIPKFDTLRLSAQGLGLFADPRATPPLLELFGNDLYLLDLSSGHDRRHPGRYLHFRLTAQQTAQIFDEAEAAGARGPLLLPDPDGNSGIERQLVLIRDGGETARVVLGGEVGADESGPDVALRRALAAYLLRLLDPVSSYGIGEGEAAPSTRYLVVADTIPAGGSLGAGARSWDGVLPSGWAGGCHIYTGGEAAGIAETLAGEPFGRVWRDGAGGLWLLTGRPVTPAEPAPCRE